LPHGSDEQPASPDLAGAAGDASHQRLQPAAGPLGPRRELALRASSCHVFSAAPPGNRLPAGWTHQTLPSVERANRFDLLADDGRTVLRVLSDRSASSLALAKRVDPAATPLLRWRWRVSHPVAGSDLRRKAGDDYAARVYVLFDLPPERLGVGDRMKMAAARLLHGAELPAAALCYVWGTAQAAGESGWNAYTDRLRMIVVDSGNAHAGQWRDVVRDVAADFRAAFGDPLPVISGIALAPIPTTPAEASKPASVTSGSRRGGSRVVRHEANPAQHLGQQRLGKNRLGLYGGVDTRMAPADPRARDLCAWQCGQACAGQALRRRER
jgi:hypothetical protein